MDIRKIIVDSVDSGSDEKTMWKSVEVFYDAMEFIERLDENEYFKLTRKLHESLYGPHYDETFAMSDVNDMYHIAKDGSKVTGVYWTVEQIKNAMSEKKFPEGTTDWDKFVAAHVMWHDMSNILSESQILEAAYTFFFADSDWYNDSKIWSYMSSNC